jgi:hypothetical protein
VNRIAVAKRAAKGKKHTTGLRRNSVQTALSEKSFLPPSLPITAIGGGRPVFFFSLVLGLVWLPADFLSRPHPRI